MIDTAHFTTPYLKRHVWILIRYCFVLSQIDVLLNRACTVHMLYTMLCDLRRVTGHEYSFVDTRCAAFTVNYQVAAIGNDATLSCFTSESCLED
jgi:hypothetical protein